MCNRDNTFCASVSNVNCDFNHGQVLDNKWILKLIVKGKTIDTRVDTGAEVSTIFKKLFLYLGCREAKKTKARLVGYGDKPIPVIGHVKLSVRVPSGRSETVKFYITDNDNATLLGMPAIKALGLLPKLEINQVGGNDTLDSVSKQNWVDKYPEVFNGLGKFGEPVKLELKSGATPKAVPARLVPHKKRRKLKVELDKLVKSEVIVKDTTPVQWLSPLVLVDKPNGDLRLCLDPHYLNTQVVRAQCAIPTTPEIFSRISGSKYFTALDAKQGFHQIPLDSESSKLTSFITPYGKFRYLRLPMGISNAPEIFHQRLVDAMSDLDGVEVYIDDILIHAPTLTEHNNRLEQVMERCKQLGLTLNPEKVVLAKQSISYLGHELSAEGVSPSCSKVEAVQKMLVPEYKKAVQRFLGFVNYMAKFIPKSFRAYISFERNQ